MDFKHAKELGEISAFSHLFHRCEHKTLRFSVPHHTLPVYVGAMWHNISYEMVPK